MATEGAQARRRAEEIWREKLRQAETRYQLAAAHSRQVEAECSGGLMPSSDGNFALQKALRVEDNARAEYVQVLRTFTRLILYGEPPDESTGKTA